MRVRAFSLVFLGVLPYLAACSRPAADADGPAPPASGPSAPATAPSPAPASTTPRIIFLGDSLTAGLGLNVEQSFPSLIQERLKTAGLPYEVVNAGVSGDTSAGALRRLDWAMADGSPRVLVVALGGNDGLRGLPPEQLEQNLAAIIERGQKRGLIVILAGMEAPPNFGADYTARFRNVYPTLAKRYDVRLIPFLLDGVAGDRALNQPDGIHPNPRGARLVADLVWRALEPALAEARPTTPR
ncbi:MAG: arylesterase [Planctomycetota bacterium]|nr:arylesterase [Planctomycetota bacterium]